MFIQEVLERDLFGLLNKGNTARKYMLSEKEKDC